jgi:parallel beta-helix repeat protein
MKNKTFILVIIILIFFLSFLPITISNKFLVNNVIYVNDDGDADYTKIQDAIDNANANDTIFVYEGFYKENIFIHKTLKIIGENRDKTIIDGGGLRERDCIFILTEANNVEISNFTIQNSGGGDSGGDFDSGIDIRSDDNIIIFNDISNNGNLGIQLFNSDGNNISNNNFFNNDRAGLEAENSNNNLILNNEFNNNTEWGVIFHYIGKSTSNIISRNTFIGNSIGLAFVRQTGNEILKNNFINNVAVNARSDFDILSTNSIFNNRWNENYWDDKYNPSPKLIPGFLSINIDWNPVLEPYYFFGVDQY